MQMCPECSRVYDETEHSKCPFCTDVLADYKGERYYKKCTICGGIMYWDDYWECSNCNHEIHTGEDDNDGIIEG